MIITFYNFWQTTDNNDFLFIDLGLGIIGDFLVFSVGIAGFCIKIEVLINRKKYEDKDKN